jgi:hypothetical protein
MCNKMAAHQSVLVPFTSIQSLEKLSTNGQAATKSFSRSANMTVANGKTELGVVALPNGRAIYATMGTNESEKGWSGSFYTELSGCKIVVLAAFEAGTAEANFKASIFREGSEKPLVSLAWKTKYDGSVNGGGFLTGLTADVAAEHTNVTKNCVIDCVLRHAPNCSLPCSFGPKPCLACGGAIAACCAINCHC